MPTKTKKKSSSAKASLKKSSVKVTAVKKNKSALENKAAAKTTHIKIAESESSKEIKSKIRIKLRAYDYKVIDNSTKQIIETALRYGAEILGPIPLPTEVRKYTVNRSTFIHKDAREQFEMRVHKRLIDILNPNPNVIDALMNLTLPAGVDIEIKIY